MDSLLRKYCEKRKIVLRKGENFHILLTLAWNRVLLFKLKLHKWLHGIKKPIVHYYAVCWNEEKMLPFMFQYYDQFVDHYTIYDNYSDDNSESIIRSHKNADIVKYQTDGFNDEQHAKIKNQCWKQSRGKADWVVVCDIDEFIFHKDLSEKILSLKAKRYTLVKPFGYNMFSKDYPEYCPEKNLTDLVRNGVSAPIYDKCIFFDPHAIVEINYDPGAHVCNPLGRVKTHRQEDIKLLHYKNIGLEYILARTRIYAARLSKTNTEKKYGEEYLKKEWSIVAEFNEGISNSTTII